jgi:AAA domain-containing protein
MNLFSLTTTGPILRARRIVLYGPNGIGKSTLASRFPSPLFLDLEDGTSELNVCRINITGFDQFEAVYKTLLSDHPGISTVVIDPGDALEKFLRIKLCAKHRKTGIEEFPYGKGWQYLTEEFERILNLLDALIALGIHVVVVCHSTVRSVYLPELSDPFDRYELQLYDRNSARLRQWADAVLFLNWFVRVQESSSGRMRGLGGKERVIYTTHSASYDAKNRASLPEKLNCQFFELAPLFAGAQPIVEPIAQPVKSVKSAAQGGSAQPAPAELSAQQRLKKALSGLHEDWVINFLVDRQKIVAGQTVLDAPVTYCEDALARISEFREAIIKFGKEHDEIPV